MASIMAAAAATGLILKHAGTHEIIRYIKRKTTEKCLKLLCKFTYEFY
jgi:hypothetical protein